MKLDGHVVFKVFHCYLQGIPLLSIRHFQLNIVDTAETSTGENFCLLKNSSVYPRKGKISKTFTVFSGTLCLASDESSLYGGEAFGFCEDSDKSKTFLAEGYVSISTTNDETSLRLRMTQVLSWGLRT